MRQEARVQATIELTDAWLETMQKGRLPADKLVGNFFRGRRYAGSKDRRFITEHFYSILRDLSALRTVLRAAEHSMSGRGLVIVWLYKHQSQDISCFGMDSDYAPAALTEDEKSLETYCLTTELTEIVTLNIPLTYSEAFQQRFGEDLTSQLTALNEKTTLTMRTNPLKINRDKAFGKLVGAGHRLQKTPLSPYGFAFEKNTPLGTLDLYKSGDIEVQDEAAQLASMLVTAGADDHVIDLCAGAGGKSLMIAAMAAGAAKMTAFDIDKRRLGQLQERATRAGVDIHRVQIPPAGTRRHSKLAPYAHQGTHVIVDAPCSGTGTWRRTPDLRWRMDQHALDDLSPLQSSLLEDGSKLTAVGGYLYYMTCSLLVQENEAIVDHFLAENKQFERINAQERLADCLESNPVTFSFVKNDQDILFTPKSHAMDGFYISILKRVS